MTGLRSPLRERLDVDQPAYLVPRTIGCARECWSQPRVIVLALADGVAPVVTVRLPDGRVIETHGDNVQKSRPAEPRSRRASNRPRPAAVDCEEVPLW